MVNQISLEHSSDLSKLKQLAGVMGHFEINVLALNSGNNADSKAIFRHVSPGPYVDISSPPSSSPHIHNTMGGKCPYYS